MNDTQRAISALRAIETERELSPAEESCLVGLLKCQNEDNQETEGPEQIGPFPQEPVFGSPEAVVQHTWNDSDGFEWTATRHSGVRCTEMRDSLIGAVPAGNEILDLRQQREALADALEAYMLDHLTDLPTAEQDSDGCHCQRCMVARATLRKAGR